MFNRTPFVCLGTSLNPIDAAALSFLAADKQLDDRPPTVSLLNRNVRSVAKGINRIKQAAGSVSLPLMVTERTETLRPLYLPWYMFNDQATANLFLKLYESMPERCREQAARASKILQKDKTGLQLMHVVLSEISSHPVEMWDSYKFRRTARGRQAMRTALETIQRSITSSFTEVSFRKGGYIEVAGQQLRKVDEPTMGSIISTTDEELSLKGPLELLYLSAIGELTHLPWYCDDVREGWRSESVSVREYISPISCSARSRTASQFEDHFLRLNPQAYSLIDFPSPEATDFVSAVVGEEVTYPELENWRNFAYRYPRASQKALKDQHHAASLCAQQIALARRGFVDGELLSDEIVQHLRDGTIPRTSKFGLTLIELCALLRVIERIAKNGETSLPIVAQLTGLGLSDEQRFTVDHKLVKFSQDVDRAARQWNQTIAPAEGEVWPEFEDVKRAFEVRRSYAVSDVTPVTADSFGRLAKRLEESARDYYRRVIALMNGPLKANPWNLWLAFGADSKRHAEMVLSLRQRKTIMLTAELWN